MNEQHDIPPTWHPCVAFIALPDGTKSLRDGWKRGVLHMRPHPEKPEHAWLLTQTPTGYLVAKIKSNTKKAFKIADELHDCGNWDFGDDIYGVLDNPELRIAAKAILEKYWDITAKIA